MEKPDLSAARLKRHSLAVKLVGITLLAFVLAGAVVVVVGALLLKALLFVFTGSF